MGVDLTVSPIRHATLDWWLCYERIRFDRDYELFGQIDKFGRGKRPVVCHPLPIPVGKRVQWYGDDGLETITTNPYGTPLTYIVANEFRKLVIDEYGAGCHDGISLISDWNRAVMAMLTAMPPDTPVVLYWS